MKTYRYSTGYIVENSGGNNDLFSTSYGQKYFITFEKNLLRRKNLPDIILNREVIINATSLKRAIEISRLIYASLCLINRHCHPTPWWDADTIPKVTPLDTDERDPFFNDYMEEKTVHGPNYMLAIKIANRVSKSNKLTDALITYKIACCLHSNESWILNPFDNKERIAIPPHKEDRIRMAFAIEIYYASLEGLGLGYPYKPPDFYKKYGKKTSKKIIEKIFYKNLEKIGMKETDRILWLRRNSKTKIHKQKGIEGDSVQYKKPYVFDKMITFFSAIDEISWIRSHIVAHHIDEEFIDSVSIYDVANANSLARRLLIQKFGFWGDYFKVTPIDEESRKKQERDQKEFMRNWIKSIDIQKIIQILYKRINNLRESKN